MPSIAARFVRWMRARQSVTVPNRALAVAAWMVIGVSAVQILCFAFGRDQGIYAMVGQGILRGEMPYRDVWDFKPPGIFAMFALAEVLFGPVMSSIRIVEIVAWFGLTAAFIVFGREAFGSKTAGLIGAALAFFIHSQLEFWHTAQPESFGAVLTAVALALTVRIRRRLTEGSSMTGAVVLVGALFGLAFLFKPPLGGGAVVCAAYLGRARYDATRRLGGAAALIVGMGAASVLPILSCGAWFWARGAWPDLAWTLFEFTPGYTSLGWNYDPLYLFYFGAEMAVTYFSEVLPAGMAAALLLRPIHSREREGLFLILGIVAVHVAGITMQAKFFQYHYAATLPLLALVAGLGLYKAMRRLARWGPAAQLALAAIVILLAARRTAVRTNPGTFWERSLDRFAFLAGMGPGRTQLNAKLYRVADYDFGADQRVAEAVQQRVEPGSAIFVWGFEPVVYWLADRPAASRFVYNVAQRTRWEQHRARELLMTDLERRPPVAFVVEHDDVFDYVTGDSMDSAQALGDFPKLAAFVATGYEFTTQVGKFDVYMRRPVAGPAASGPRPKPDPIASGRQAPKKELHDGPVEGGSPGRRD